MFQGEGIDFDTLDDLEIIDDLAEGEISLLIGYKTQ